MIQYDKITQAENISFTKYMLSDLLSLIVPSYTPFIIYKYISIIPFNYMKY